MHPVNVIICNFIRERQREMSNMQVKMKLNSQIDLKTLALRVKERSEKFWQPTGSEIFKE